MMKLLTTILAAVAILAITKWALFPTYTHRYKVTLEVEVDGKLVHDSNVVEVAWRSNGPLTTLFQGKQFEVSIWGQASMLDLGPHGLLFGTLGSGVETTYPSPSASLLAMRAFTGIDKRIPDYSRIIATSGSYGSVTSEILEAVAEQKISVNLIPHNVPPLVWLRDGSDFASAIPIPPTELSQSIAPGVHLRSATLQLTKDRVRFDIKTRWKGFDRLLAAYPTASRSYHPKIFKMTPELILMNGN